MDHLTQLPHPDPECAEFGVVSAAELPSFQCEVLKNAVLVSKIFVHTYCHVDIFGHLSLFLFIKKNVRKHGDKTYTTHLLVEWVNTPPGPRHRTICNLGHRTPGPKEEWLELAERIQAALSGQPSLFIDPRVDEAVALLREQQAKGETKEPTPRKTVPDTVVELTDGVNSQDSRLAATRPKEAIHSQQNWCSGLQKKGKALRP